MKKTKISALAVLIILTVVIAGVASAARISHKKGASARPVYTSLSGTVSNADASANAFTLTTPDGQIYTVSTDLIKEKQAAGDAKLEASLARRESERAKLLAKNPKLKKRSASSPVRVQRPDPNNLEIVDGMYVTVIISGEASGTNLSAIAVREASEIKRPVPPSLPVPPVPLKPPVIRPRTPTPEASPETIINTPIDTQTTTSTDSGITPDATDVTPPDSSNTNTPIGTQTPPDTDSGITPDATDVTPPDSSEVL
ncbi:MAG TPA: hypothetical protein VK675_02320 [Candidatus Paceibacterota bacterium]|nr:hypothetical protein [Candidatus Paceibacterota bacterium]